MAGSRPASVHRWDRPAVWVANPATVAELRAFLDDYWTSGLEKLRDVAEAAETRKRQKERA